MLADPKSEQMDVILANMPFHGYWPSLGLSLLKACLFTQNIPNKVLYFGLPLAERIGRELYHCIASGYPRPMDLLGEWIFSPALFDSDSSAYLDEILIKRSQIYTDVVDHTVRIPDDFFRKVRIIQTLATDYVGECAEEVLRYSPKVVGIGSVFHQQMSSLALARRLKELAPEIFIVMGGGNCEGIMGAEIARQFPFVDAVVSGEGELVFPQIVQRVLRNENVSDLLGMYTAENISAAFAANRFPSAAKVAHLDDLPYPDYNDFFLQRAESILDFKRQILFETSRGCWWGERSHCTFCGISDDIMTYRSKSPQRALEEITYLAEKYCSAQVHVVDCILDMRYFKDFLPQLAERHPKLDLFYEVKANLKKEQVGTLLEAGVTTIQPGIESFSNSVLQLMGKGVTALQNIQLLKWCKELGMRVSWNILWGFPGEDPQEYLRMTGFIPYLAHLPSPQAAARIRLDRFSPNFDRAAELGLSDVRPHPAYFHLYPFSADVVANLAYFFVYDYQDQRDVMSYTQALWNEVEKWWNAESDSDLFCVDEGSHLLIWDLRAAADQPLTVLTGLQKVLYEFCQTVRTFGEIEQLVEKEAAGKMPAPPHFPTLLEPILNRGLMIQDHKSYLSLAIPLGVYQPKEAVLKKLCSILEIHEGELTLTIPETAYCTDV